MQRQVQPQTDTSWGYKPPPEYASINIPEMMERNEALLKEWEGYLSSNDFSDESHNRQEKLKNVLQQNFSVLARMADSQIRAMKSSQAAKQQGGDRVVQQPPPTAPLLQAEGARNTAVPQQARQYVQQPHQYPQHAQQQQPRHHHQQQAPQQGDQQRRLLQLLQHMKEKLSRVADRGKWRYCLEAALRAPPGEPRYLKALADLAGHCLVKYTAPLAKATPGEAGAAAQRRLYAWAGELQAAAREAAADGDGPGAAAAAAAEGGGGGGAPVGPGVAAARARLQRLKLDVDADPIG